MADSPSPPRGEFDNDTRQAIFIALVEADASRTPTGVADEVGTSRELAYHHLSKLVEMGIVTRSDGEYRPQPLFTDPSFDTKVVDATADLLPAAAERVVFPVDADSDTMQVTVFNCLRMKFAMTMFSEVEPPDD